MADKASFEKLNNGNYVHWSFRMKMVLIEKDLWQLIDPDVNHAAPAADRAAEEATQLQKALAVISLNVDDDQLIHVQNAANGRDAWLNLRVVHQRSTIGSKIRLLSRLFRTRMGPGESMQTHLNKMNEIISQLNAISADAIDEEVAVCAIMQSVHDDYDTIITAMEAWPDERLTLGNVMALLIEEYDRKVEKEVHETAFAVTMGGRPQKRRTFMCYWCDGVGHLKRDCILFKKYLEELQHAPESTKSTTSNNLNKNKESARLARMNKWYSDFVFDSGASSHVCNDKSKLSDFTDSDSREIFLADGNSVTSEGVGSIVLTVYPRSENPMKVTLHEVLFVPEMEENLISVHKLNEKGFDVLFSSDDCYLVKGVTKILVGCYEHGLYRLFMKPTEQARTVMDQKARCVHQWHEILAHRNVSDIKRMGKNGLSIRKCHCEYQCESCIKGKMTRKPFKLSENRPKDFLEIVATDLCGPLHVESLGKARYFITFTDLYSGFCEVFTLRSKCQAATVTKQYIEQMTNLTGKKLKILRSDRGTEYLNDALQSYLRDQGIKFQCTTGYASQQNGAAERQNRTLMDATRTLLADSKLPMSFWGEAVKHVTFVNNRIFNKRLGMTPLEALFGTKPNYCDMYAFGSDVYERIPDEKRRKLDFKAVKRIFVGHDERSKGYRVADPQTYKITVTREIELVKRINDKRSLASVNLDSRTCKIEQDDSDDSNDDSCDDSNDDSSDENYITEEEEEEFHDASSASDVSEHELPLRRSTRSNFGIPPSYLNNYHCYVVKETEKYEPRSYKEAITCAAKHHWIAAMEEELSSIRRNATWEPTDLPAGRSMVGSKWVFKIKTDEEGNATYKARLVAQGFTQKFGIDYDEVFAPVARSETFRILLIIANVRNLEVRQYDFKTAFLNGELKEEIYMRPPLGVPTDGKVLKLKKSLYGLKQAAKVWNDSLHGVLLKYGCVQSQYDQCLYSHGEGESKLYLIMHVDDLLVAYKDEKQLESVINGIRSHFELKDLGKVHSYLGINIERNEQGIFCVSQPSYIDKIVSEANLGSAKVSKHPVDPGYYKLDSEDLNSNDEYRKLIGMLLYLAINSRPDIAASIAILSQKISKPTASDMTEVKRVIRYLKGTRNAKLKLGGGGKDVEVLTVFSDANWAEDKVDRKSNSGYVIDLFGGPIAWSCRKQNLVALSSCEAEYIALCETTKEVAWLRGLISDFGVNIEEPVNIQTDSQSCIAMVKDTRLSRRTKHVDIKYHFVKEMCNTGLVKLTYVPSEENVADIMTKPLGPTRIKKLRELIGIEIEEEC